MSHFDGLQHSDSTLAAEMTASRPLADACGPHSDPPWLGAYHTEPTSCVAFNALQYTAVYCDHKNWLYLAVIDASLAQSKKYSTCFIHMPCHPFCRRRGVVINACVHTLNSCYGRKKGKKGGGGDWSISIRKSDVCERDVGPDPCHRGNHLIGRCRMIP